MTAINVELPKAGITVPGYASDTSTFGLMMFFLSDSEKENLNPDNRIVEAAGLLQAKLQAAADNLLPAKTEEAAKDATTKETPANKAFREILKEESFPEPKTKAAWTKIAENYIDKIALRLARNEGYTEVFMKQIGQMVMRAAEYVEERQDLAGHLFGVYDIPTPYGSYKKDCPAIIRLNVVDISTLVMEGIAAGMRSVNSEETTEETTDEL